MRRSSSEEIVDQPIALNLAKIVFDLLKHPRGRRVQDLMAELRIKPRTYRKYRALLQNHFDHLWDSHGDTLVVEERDGDGKWLRLRDNVSRDGFEDGALYSHLVALEFARQAIRRLQGRDALDPSLDTVFYSFVDRVKGRTYVYRDLLEHLQRKVYYLSPPPKDYQPHQRTLQTILRALFHFRKMHVVYETANGVRRSVLEPLTLILWNGGLYLVARKQGSKMPLLYVVDRFREVSLSPHQFRYPRPEEYRPETYLDGHFGIFHEDREPVNVELVFAAKQWLKLFLMERLWHPTQEFSDLPDGRLRMRFRARCLTEVARFVRSFGEDVTVVEPAWLLEQQDGAPEVPESCRGTA